MDGPRACQELEFDEVLSLGNSIFREGTDQDYRTDYPLVFDQSKLENTRLVKVDGKVVSYVTFIPREVVALDDKFTIGIISSAATHSDYRKRGYASLCLRDCIGIMKESGWPISVTWTTEETIPFYQNCGYEWVASQGWVYRLGPGDEALFEEGPFKVIRYDPSEGRHLDAIMKIHNAEPYRITRSAAQYRLLFALPQISTFLAMRGQEVAAYLMFGEGMNKCGLIEDGGSTEALESLVRHVLLSRRPVQEVQVLAHLTPSSLGRLLETRKLESKRPTEEADGVGCQIMRVNSLKRLLLQIRNHLRRKSVGLQGGVRLVCEETGEAVTLKFHDGSIEFSDERLTDEVVLTRRELARLFFGPCSAERPIKCGSAAGKILQRIFPYYFPIWELDH